MAFSNNKIKSSCGREYAGPFKAEHSDFFYGYIIHEKKGAWNLYAKGQFVSTNYRRLFDKHYEIDMIKKKILLNGNETCVMNYLDDVPCPEL